MEVFHDLKPRLFKACTASTDNRSVHQSDPPLGETPGSNVHLIFLLALSEVGILDLSL